MLYVFLSLPRDDICWFKRLVLWGGYCDLAHKNVNVISRNSFILGGILIGSSIARDNLILGLW